VPVSPVALSLQPELIVRESSKAREPLAAEPQRTLDGGPAAR
jgi:hypothetical protein